MRAILVLTVCCASSLVRGQSGSIGGTISGRVIDESRVAMPGIQVAIFRVSNSPGEAQPVIGTVPTRPQGGFVFHGLEPGDYRFCFQGAPAADLLDPCDWDPPVAVRLRKDQIVNDLTITMKKGHRLPVRIQDNSGYLRTHLGKTKEANLLIGVWGGRKFFPASVDSDTQGARDFSILVPFDTDIDVSLVSSFFGFTDDQSQALTGDNVKIRTHTPRSDQANLNASRITIRLVGLKVKQ